MKIKQCRLIFILIGLIFFQSCNGQTTNEIDWQSDLDYIYDKLPKKHCDFFTIKSKKEFAAGIEKIKKKKLSGIDYALNLQQVVASFGDSHTSVGWNRFVDKTKILPLNLYWFSDGIHIIRTTRKNQSILGYKINKINNIPISVVSDSLSSLISLDNQALVKYRIPQLLRLIQVLKYFGISKGNHVDLELEDSTGKMLNYSLQTSIMNKKNLKTFKTSSVPLCDQKRELYFSDYYSAKDDIYYLQYNRCWSKELEIQYKDDNNAEKMPSFQKFEKKIFTKLKDKPIGKMVFDLRFNGGGSSVQGTEFIRRLAEYCKQNSDLKLYVVLGRKTFSSAVINAMDFKNMTNAVFVGEETGGKPNHFGEVKSFKLPSSEVWVNYSTKYFVKSTEDMNTIVPDVLIESNFIDYKNGIDPVYEWIRNQN